MIYDILLTVIGLSPGGSSTVHIYTQTVHRMTQNRQYIEQQNNLGECGPCPVLASYTLAFFYVHGTVHSYNIVLVSNQRDAAFVLLGLLSLYTFRARFASIFRSNN